MSGSATVKIPTAERLINLSAFLLDSKRPKTLREILDEVTGYEKEKDYESNRRMFIRDKKALAELDIPIRLVRTEDPRTGCETEAYTIDPKDFYLPAISFTNEEAEALAGLGHRFSGAGSGSLLKELEWALAKIASASGTPAPGASADNVLLCLERGGAGADPVALATIRDAIGERRSLDVRYHPPASGKSSKRRVDPYGLFLRRGLWYLYGWCRLRKGMRTFRVDRMEIAGPPKGEGPDFELPENFSISEQIAGRAPWEYGDGEEAAAVVRLHADAFWQARNAWGDLASVSFDEKQLTMTVKSVNDGGLIGWALGLGDRAEIVSPPAIRKKMARALKGIMSNARA